MNRAKRVHVSLSELRTAASRALHGAGAPAGTERDGARSAVWLESRGLRGAAALVSELGAVAEAGTRPPSFAGNRVDLAGGPVLTWGSTLIETAMLAAGTAIVLAGCRTPGSSFPKRWSRPVTAGAFGSRREDARPSSKLARRQWTGRSRSSMPPTFA